MRGEIAVLQHEIDQHDLDNQMAMISIHHPECKDYLSFQCKRLISGKLAILHLNQKLYRVRTDNCEILEAKFWFDEVNEVYKCKIKIIIPQRHMDVAEEIQYD